MSDPLLHRAMAALPGGVNSPVRAFKSVGGKPIFAERAEGPYLHTTGGRKLIDFCMSFGPLILGHAHPRVVEAVTRAAEGGTSFAVTTEAEVELAERIKEAFPSMERVRLVNSGTEACMAALRLARGATGRNKILKFTGCYHGHSDGLLVEAGSGVAGIASASSAGVTPATAAETLVAPYNDPMAVTKLVEEHGADLAVIAVEPVGGNMGVVLPDEGFLEHLRDLCDECGALLLFDEVMTGFRITFGGYQRVCGVIPDLTCLGKIIGGGMPIGALGGPADVMEQLAPMGSVYQAGTLSGNPISVASGLATLRVLKEENPYPDLNARTGTFIEAARKILAGAGIPVQAPVVGSMTNLFFSDTPVRNFDDANACDTARFRKFFHGLLEQGVYLPPSAYEAYFLSTAHDSRILEQTLSAVTDVAGGL